jgi:small-conductance mechanosensitive channel
VNADPVARIERTAWACGALLAAGSLALRSASVTAGVCLGVLVAVLNYRHLVRFVRSLVDSGARSLPRGRWLLYFSKYAVSGAVIVAALRYRVADPIALLVGASVLLPAILRESACCAHPASSKEA